MLDRKRFTMPPFNSDCVLVTPLDVLVASSVGVLAAVAPPGILGSSDQSKRDFPSLERRHSVAVDQRDFSLGAVIHSVNAACRDEVPGPDDKMFHKASIHNERALPKSQKPPTGSCRRLQRSKNILQPKRCRE